MPSHEIPICPRPIIGAPRHHSHPRRVTFPGMRWLLQACGILLTVAPGVLAQSTETSLAAPAPAAPSVSEKWNLFATETFAPFTLGAGAFNAAVSQATNSAPLYGRTLGAYPDRFGAAVGDIVTQNFFGDFLLASAFHEDTRYVRRGPAYKLLPRVAYAISRALVTHTDSGALTFNWSNVIGTGMSAGLSNAYYPPTSRTGSVTLVNWGTSVAGSGFANLLPEFWPDFHDWIRRRLHPDR